MYIPSVVESKVFAGKYACLIIEMLTEKLLVKKQVRSRIPTNIANASILLDSVFPRPFKLKVPKYSRNIENDPFVECTGKAMGVVRHGF